MIIHLFVTALFEIAVHLMDVVPEYESVFEAERGSD